MRNALSVLLVAALSLPSLGQTTQGDAVIRVTTRLVQIGVVVKDKNGPVAGLKREDFTITDGGKDQKIQMFSVETNQPPADKKAEKLPAGMLTNRPSGYAGVPRNLTAILIDAYN